MKPAFTTIEQMRRPLASRACSRNQVRFGSAVKLATVCAAASTSLCAFAFLRWALVGVGVVVWAVTRDAATKRAHDASPARLYLMGFLQTSEPIRLFRRSHRGPRP